jgi:hypothetical protein
MAEHPLEAALAAFAPGRRGVCPARVDLVAYFDHSLASEATVAVRSHVAVCPFCAADLADLQALATPPLLEAVIQIAADGLRVLSHSFAASAQPRPATVRGGGGQAVELAARGDLIDLSVRVLPAAAGAADVRVQVAPSAAPHGRVRVTLQRADALLESRLAVAGEEVLFAAVSPGDYQITLAPQNGDEVARVALRLDAES